MWAGSWPETPQNGKTSPAFYATGSPAGVIGVKGDGKKRRTVVGRMVNGYQV